MNTLQDNPDRFSTVVWEGVALGLIATITAIMFCFGIVGVSLWLNAAWDGFPIISFTVAAIIGGVATSIALVGVALRMVLEEVKKNLGEL